MTTDDAPRFVERLTAVAEVFDAKLSEAKLTLYFEALKDLALADVLEGMGLAVRTCKFMPKPVELRELAVGTVEDRGEEAWIEFKDAMRRLGAYRAPVFESVLAFAITDTFGSWSAACEADLSPEMWASKRKEFLRAFRRHHQREADYPPVMQLTGIFGITDGRPALHEYVEPKQVTDG